MGNSNMEMDWMTTDKMKYVAIAVERDMGTGEDWNIFYMNLYITSIPESEIPDGDLSKVDEHPEIIKAIKKVKIKEALEYIHIDYNVKDENDNIIESKLNTILKDEMCCDSLEEFAETGGFDHYCIVMDDIP